MKSITGTRLRTSIGCHPVHPPQTGMFCQKTKGHMSQTAQAVYKKYKFLHMSAIQIYVAPAR